MLTVPGQMLFWALSSCPSGQTGSCSHLRVINHIVFRRPWSNTMTFLILVGDIAILRESKEKIHQKVNNSTGTSCPEGEESGTG